jgi:hypothetical protein
MREEVSLSMRSCYFCFRLKAERSYPAGEGTSSGGSRSPFGRGVSPRPLTKVNRCLAEGRARLRQELAG